MFIYLGFGVYLIYGSVCLFTLLLEVVLYMDQYFHLPWFWRLSKKWINLFIYLDFGVCPINGSKCLFAFISEVVLYMNQYVYLPWF